MTSTPIDPRIFRAYDIRGKALIQLTPEACQRIAHAFGTVLKERYGGGETDFAPTVVVGRDARTHSPELEASVIEGLVAAGCAVQHIGQTPSPVNYFAICHGAFDAGIQVTASHNPKEDNGLKLQLRDAEAYAGEDLQDLRKRVERGAPVADGHGSTLLTTGDPRLRGRGSVEEFDGITSYLDFLERTFGRVGDGLHVVVDGGNGVAGPVYADVLRRAGAEVTGMYLEPDGMFPNHPADPSKYETLRELQAKVVEVGADIGFGFDGDGDRVGVVDERGMIVTADQVLLLLAHDHLKRHPGTPVVFTVSNSGLLQSEVLRWGGIPVLCKVGHSFVEHAMREHGAMIGGEQSGHFFLGEDYFGYDDALVAALRILKILQTKNPPLSSLISQFPKVFAAPERRPHCPDDRKFQIMEQLTETFAKQYPVSTLDGVRVDFGDSAWAGLRASNTSPALSICIEARSPEKLQEVEAVVLAELKNYPEVLLL